MSRSFILTYFSRSFMVSILMFTSLMHFKLIFVGHVRYGSSFILLHVVVQLLSHAWLFVTPWIAACQAPLSSLSWSLSKFMSMEWVMLSNPYHHPLPPPSPLPLTLSQHQGLSQWIGCLHQVAEYWSFSFRISFSSEYSGLISFRIDLFNYPSMIFWRACLFSIEYSWLLCQMLADWICFGLFMGSPFSSIGVFVWFYASTKRYWWL